MGSKSGDWYKALRESDPEAHRKIMDDKYARRVQQVNSNPDKFAQMKYSKQRAGARDRKLAWDLTEDDVHKLIKETKVCSISGRQVVLEINHPDGSSIDRIDNKRGYHLDNVHVVSQLVNKARGEMTIDEFVIMCKQVAEYHK